MRRGLAWPCMLEQLDHLLSHFALYLGVAVEVLALALVPLVLLRRKEPSSTFAWILTLVFLPGLGAALFLLHGRDRVRWPARRKRAADEVLTSRLDHARRETRVDPSGAVGELDDFGQPDGSERSAVCAVPAGEHDHRDRR